MQNNLHVPATYRAVDGTVVSSLPSGAVFRRDGKPMTNSRIVAELFGKQHKNVLQAIDRLLKLDPDLGLGFQPETIAVSTGKGGTRHVRGYAINQRGAALLVMGFTGPEALQWKQKFLDAFDHLAEREKDNYFQAMKALSRSPSVYRQKRRRALL